MTRILTLAVLLNLPVLADEITLTPHPDRVRVGPPGRLTRAPRLKPERWEFFAAGGLAAADVASSWGMHETNPVLGRGGFGVRQTAIKTAITGGVLYAAWKIRKEHPRLAWAIVITASASSAFGAAHNYTIRWGAR